MAPLEDLSLAEGSEVARQLGSDTEAGLSSAEAQERLARVGPNRLEAGANAPAWRKFLAQFADPLIYLLLAAIVVSVVAWALEGAEGIPIAAIVIALIVLANGVLAFVAGSPTASSTARCRSAWSSSASSWRLPRC